MGCAASRKLYDETRIDVAKPEAFPVAPGSQRLKQASKYALPQSLNQMAGYDICDADGKVRPRDLILRCHHGHTSFSIAPLLARQLRFKIKYISLTDQKVLTDASGKKVFMIRGKVLTFVTSLYFFTYSPNFAGQTPTEHDGDAPLYKFARCAPMVGDAHHGGSTSSSPSRMTTSKRWRRWRPCATWCTRPAR